MTTGRLMIAVSAFALVPLAPSGVHAADCTMVGNPPICVRDDVKGSPAERIYQAEKERELRGDGPALVPIPSTGPSPFGTPKSATPPPSSSSPRPPPQTRPPSPAATAGSYCYIPGKRIFRVPGPPAACRAHGAVPAPDFVGRGGDGDHRQYDRSPAYPGRPHGWDPPSGYHGYGYPSARPYGAGYYGPSVDVPHGYYGMGYPGGYR